MSGLLNRIKRCGMILLIRIIAPSLTFGLHICFCDLIRNLNIYRFSFSVLKVKTTS